MISMVQKIILGMLMASGASSAVTVMIAYRIVTKFTQRPTYSAHRLQQHEANRATLITQFQAEPITFQTEDGLNLSGLLILRPQAKRNLLVCHGYHMSKERMIGFASMFSDDNVLLFDYRAHGQSEGLVSTIGHAERKDVQAAFKVFHEHAQTKALPTFGIGVSMGAVSLLAAAVEMEGFKGLILDSPFSRLDIQASRVFAKKFNLPRIPFEFVGRYLFEYLLNFSMEEVNCVAYAQKIQTPILIIHSKNDDTAAVTDAHHLYDRLTGKKDLWLVDESGHARIFDDCTLVYQERVNQFLNTIV